MNMIHTVEMDDQELADFIECQVQLNKAIDDAKHLKEVVSRRHWEGAKMAYHNCLHAIEYAQELGGDLPSLENRVRAMLESCPK